MNHHLPILLPPTTPPNCRMAHTLPTIQRLISSGIVAPRSTPCQLAPVTWSSGIRKEPTIQEESPSQANFAKNEDTDDDHARGRGNFGNNYESPSTRARGRATRWAPYIVYEGMSRSWQYTPTTLSTSTKHTWDVHEFPSGAHIIAEPASTLADTQLRASLVEYPGLELRKDVVHEHER
ncbi:hypothetical protein QAD02_015224 [Eretmocerus hayati]|uniref:Uncharacterized protein n=1 Tax=Eretmocerus hayati TaxID=131215 RepID=A0ACC2PAE6_9HYME|nr:hypothetical protein QAD02_015224 [Eretmocerus hayati]